MIILKKFEIMIPSEGLAALIIVLLVRVVGMVMALVLLGLPAAAAGNFTTIIEQMMADTFCTIFLHDFPPTILWIYPAVL